MGAGAAATTGLGVGGTTSGAGTATLAVTTEAGVGTTTGAGATAGTTGVGSGLVVAATVAFGSTAGSTTAIEGGWKLVAVVGAAVSTFALGVDAATVGSEVAGIVGEGIGRCSAICGVRENMWITMPAEI